MKNKVSNELFLLINSYLPFYRSFYGKSSRKIARSPSLLVCYSFKKATASLVSSRYLIVSSYSFEARHINKISITWSWAIREDVAPLLNVASLAADVCNWISDTLLTKELPYFVILIVIAFLCFANVNNLATSDVAPEKEIPTTTSSAPLLAMDVAAICISE